MPDEKAESTPISLYPTQIAIVERFAKHDGRSFSNALQFIIEDWARCRQAFKPTAPQKNGNPKADKEASA